MPFCTNCGSSIKTTDKFCSECGQLVKQKQETQLVRQVDDKKREEAPLSYKVDVAPARSRNRDEMIVTLNTQEIGRGVKLEGKATLYLVKPQKKGLYVLLELVAEHREVLWDADLDRETRFQRIYEYRAFLDGEKEYSAGKHEYNFSITVPENLEEWRMKRESILMKKLGFKQNQYQDQKIYDPKSLTWYMIVLFNKRQLGLAIKKQIPLSFTG
jgi:hypothetical protein